MMKNPIAFILFVSVLIITSCDYIEQPYTTGTIPDTTTAVKQKVLVEYHTGHYCINCPTAANELKLLQQTYGERLIYISIHSDDWFAGPHASPYEADYRSPESKDIADRFSVVTFPTGVINRKKFNNDFSLNHTAWAAIIADELTLTPKVEISINGSLQGNTISADLSVEALESIDGTHHISVYIAEDGLISAQKNNNPNIGTTPDITDYEHKYVLRTSMNGTWGEEIFTDALPGDTFSKQLSATKHNDWNAEKIYLICIITDYDTDEVIQVEMKKLQ
jgi:hypothetical protein